MNWKVKGTIQKTLSALPGGSQCNFFLQRVAGGLRNDDFLHHVFRQDILVLFERMARIGLDPASDRVFEIGTGWMPLLPLCLAVCGFRNIYTVDLVPHLRSPLIRRTLIGLREHLSHPCLQAFSSLDQIEARYDRLLKANDILAAAGITYIAPCDASRVDLKPGSLDLIVSNNVFEHVPHVALLALFSEAKRLLRPGGHVLHCVNCGDHYAYADSSISQVNYLQFSDEEWSRWNNPIHYQNRLRPVDFIQMADGIGFEINSAEYKPNERHVKLLEQMVIAPEFRRYSLDQLAATSITLIASA